MKFTRMFVLKILSKNKYEINNNNNINNYNYYNDDNYNINDNNAEDIFRDILLTNGNIDFFILLLLNILIILSKFDLNYSNNEGLYITIFLNILISIIYFLLFVLNNNLTSPNLNIKKHISLPNSFNFNKSNSKSVLDENLINKKNDNNYNEFLNNVFNNKLKINLPYFITNKYWHLFNCLFHLIQNLIFLSSFGISFIFYILYKAYESEYNKKFNYLHIILLQILEFYSIFRILFFILKILLNIIMIPLYISSIFLGFVEDNFNLELNNIINTREYKGRDSKIIEDSCAICLGGFFEGDTISTLPCNKFHSFHTICLEEWFYTNVCCPLCRSDFNDKIRKLIPNNNNNNNENQNNNNDLNNFNNNRFEMQEINPFNNNNI